MEGPDFAGIMGQATTTDTNGGDVIPTARSKPRSNTYYNSRSINNGRRQRDLWAGYSTASTSSCLTGTTGATSSSEFLSRRCESLRSVLTSGDGDDDDTGAADHNKIAIQSTRDCWQRRRPHHLIPHEAELNSGAVVDALLNNDALVQQQREILQQITKTPQKQACCAPTEVPMTLPLATVASIPQATRITATTVPTFGSSPRDNSSEPKLPTTTTSNVSSLSDSDDYDFVKYLQDPALIQEQQRIFDQLQQQRLQKRDQLDVHSTVLSREVDHLTESIAQASLEEYIYSNSNRDVTGQPLSEPRRTSPRLRRDELPSTSRVHHPTLITNKSSDLLHSEETIPTAHIDDKVVDYGNGKKVRVKGTKHAWKAVADGNAVLVQCPQCSCVLQVGSSAKRLYCTQCQHVSRIETCTLNSSTISAQDNHRIARIVQQHEMNVAYARKLAKMHRNES